MQMDLKLLLGILGNIASMGVYLSPAPTILQIWKQKSTQEFSALPYACALLNSLIWGLYGTPYVRPHSTLILSISAFGTCTELFFISVFFLFASQKIKIRVARYLICVSVLYCGAVMVAFIGLHSKHLRQILVGSFGMGVSIAMYASPLSIMGLVVRTKSVEFMPFTVTSCNFVNSAIWSAYALITRDIFVGIPNGLGCLFGVLQFILYGVFYKRPVTQPLKLEDDLDKMEATKHSLCVTIEKIQK